MRLPILEEGLRPLQKAQLRLVTALGLDPGPIVTVSYRRELFGRPFVACMSEGMRGSRHWSRGELELFAAFVSKLNSCAY